MRSAHQFDSSSNRPASHAFGCGGSIEQPLDVFLPASRRERLGEHGRERRGCKGVEGSTSPNTSGYTTGARTESARPPITMAPTRHRPSKKRKATTLEATTVVAHRVQIHYFWSTGAVEREFEAPNSLKNGCTKYSNLSGSLLVTGATFP